MPQVVPILLCLTYIITSSVAFVVIRSNLSKSHASQISLTSLPDINYGLKDDEFKYWLLEEVKDCPGRNTYSSVYDDSVNAIVKWRKRYRGEYSTLMCVTSNFLCYSYAFTQLIFY